MYLRSREGGAANFHDVTEALAALIRKEEARPGGPVRAIDSAFQKLKRAGKIRYDRDRRQWVLTTNGAFNPVTIGGKGERCEFCLVPAVTVMCVGDGPSVYERNSCEEHRAWTERLIFLDFNGLVEIVERDPNSRG